MTIVIVVSDTGHCFENDFFRNRVKRNYKLVIIIVPKDSAQGRAAK